MGSPRSQAITAWTRPEERMSKFHSWTVREAMPGDDAALSELFYVVFGFDRSVDHYRWKFQDNPQGPPVIALAEDQGKVVGQYALWPTALRLGQQVVRGAQSLDTMTHPDYRGQGIFPILAEQCMKYAAARGIEALYGFPNGNSQPGFVRKLDWDYTGDIQIWARPLAIGRHKLVPRWAAPLASGAARLLPRGSSSGFAIRAQMPPAEAMDQVLACWRERKGLCRVERTTEHFAWRFSTASSMRYRWVCAYRGAELVAIGVWGTDIRNGNAVLAELLTDDVAAARAVLSVMIGEATAAGCPLMRAVSSRELLVPALRRCGFVREGGLPLIVRKLTARSLGANVHTHARWDLFGADLDTF